VSRIGVTASMRGEVSAYDILSRIGRRLGVPYAFEEHLTPTP
jgi:hypothetical protein